MKQYQYYQQSADRSKHRMPNNKHPLVIALQQSTTTITRKYRDALLREFELLAKEKDRLDAYGWSFNLQFNTNDRFDEAEIRMDFIQRILAVTQLYPERVKD